MSDTKKVINVPYKSCKHDGNGYLKQSDASITKINCDYASTVTSHYWRGISNNMDNIVLVIEADD